MTTALSHRQQFRKSVLNQLAIDCWITTDTQLTTQKFSADSLLSATSETDSNTVNPLPLDTVKQPQEIDTIDNNTILADIKDQLLSVNKINKDNKNNELQENQTTQKITNLSQKDNQVIENAENITHDNKDILSFTIEAIYYGEWVLLVDSDYLKDNEQLQPLWQGICSGLKAKVEKLKFPLMMTNNNQKTSGNIALANASFKGFIFRMINNNHAYLAQLTPLTDCLTDDRFTTAPTLQQMVADPSLKQQLWQMLNNTAKN